MSHVVPVTTDDFSREVLSSELPVVVDFYADWCGPCRALAPILERMAAALEDHVRFVKIDVDEETDVAGYFQVSSIPTLLIFDRGRLVDRIVGMADPRTLLSRIDQVASHTQSPGQFNLFRGTRS